jgi:hypothetical protein
MAVGWQQCSLSELPGLEDPTVDISFLKDLKTGHRQQVL